MATTYGAGTYVNGVLQGDTATATPTSSPQTAFQQSYSTGGYIPGGIGNPIQAPTTSSPVPTSQITNGSALNLPPTRPAADPSGFMASLGTLKTPTAVPSPTASVDAATASLPGGYQKINGAQYNTTALQQGAFDKIQVFGPDGKPLPAGLPANQRPAGSYLAGIPKTTSGSSSGATPTGSTSSQPQDLSLTGDYSQDPSVIAAQKAYDQSQTDVKSAMDSEPSLVDLQNQAEQKYNTAGQLAELQKTQKQIDQLNALYTTNVAQGIQQGTPAAFYSSSSMAQQLQASQLGIQLAREQGNYQMAEQLAQQTVNLQFQDAQNKINNKISLLNINSNNLSSAEKLAASKIAAQAAQDQIKLDNQKSVMNLMLTYAKAGIKTTDSLISATQKASLWLAQNPADQKLQVIGSHIVDGVKQDIYGLVDNYGNITPYNADTSSGNYNLGTSTGTLFGLPTYNTGGVNPGVVAAVRNNNPGNITATATSVKNPGVVGINTLADGRKFLIFDNPQHGMDAVAQLISTSPIYSKMNAGTAIKIYNGNGSYSAASLGLNPLKDFQTQLKDPSVLASVVQQIAKFEGFTSSSSNVETVPQPTSPEPLFSPISGIGTVSPDGQWKYSQGGWVSNLTATGAGGQYADFLQGRTPQQQAAFNSLKPLQQSNVAQLVSGQVLLADLISSRGIQGSAARQQLLADAQKVDPTFSENINKIRYQFMQKWSSTESAIGKTKLSINTALGHLAEVSKMASQLSSSDIQWINKTANWWDKQTGSPAIINLQFGLTQLASEIASVYKNGAAPTDQEVKAERDVLGINFSKSQFRGVFDTAAQFLSSKITASRYSYASTMGTEFNQSIIDPDKREQLIAAGIDPNKIVKENIPGQSSAQVIQYNGHLYQVDANGNFDPNKPLQ